VIARLQAPAGERDGLGRPERQAKRKGPGHKSPAFKRLNPREREADPPASPSRSRGDLECQGTAGRASDPEPASGGGGGGFPRAGLTGPRGKRHGSGARAGTPSSSVFGRNAS